MVNMSKGASMIARIKKNGIVYDALVFAFFSDGWDTKIIAFDETLKRLEYIRFYDQVTPYIHQQIIIVESAEDGWITTDKIKGYDWIINNDTLLKGLEQDLFIPDEIISHCLEMQKNIYIPEWFEVKDQRSAENLLEAGGYFHDGNIEFITTENDQTRITISVWGGKVHLKLENAELSPNFQVGYGSMGEIYDSNIFFEDDRIFWNDSEEVNRKEELYIDSCYFSATRMLWNVELG
jgi:hypothetical protein